VAAVNPLLQRTTFGYDAASERISVCDANNKITTTVWDLDGRRVATVDANGNRTTQVFDAAGRRVAVVDPRGNRTTFAYNDANWHIVRIDPLNHRTTLAYDNDGRQTLRLDARGYRTTYAYDDADRLTGRRYPDGSRVTFAYNALGNRTLMQDANGRTTFAYDVDRRLASVVNPAGKRITYGYDAASQRTLLVEPGSGRFTYVWDVAGRLDYLLNPQNLRTSYTYDAADRVTTQRLGNGIWASYGYDDADRLLKLAHITSAGTTVSSFYYAVDPVGNRTRVVEVDGTRVTWGYDNDYQLTNENRSGTNGYNITYTYDQAGNRKTMQSGGVTSTYTCDAANQLNTLRDNTGTTSFSYDANGNQTLKVVPGGARTTLTWDFESRLTQVALPSGVPNTFVYDADGKRVQKRDSAGTTKPIWDLDNILEETDGSNITQLVYTQSTAAYGRVVSQFRTASQFYLFGGLGSTDRLTDATSAVTDSYVYQAFGSPQASTGSSSNPFRYVGELGYYFDPDLSWYYLRARYYDPSLGRFASRDLLPDYSYCYVANNPVNRADPSGFMPSWLESFLVPRFRLQCRGPADDDECTKACVKDYGAGATGNCTYREHFMSLPDPDGGGIQWEVIHCECYNCKPPGKCEQDIYDILRRDVVEKCKETVTRRCVDDWTRDQVWRMLQNWLACYRARKVLDDKCWQGGNRRHKEQQQAALKAAVRCRRVYDRLWQPGDLDY
jgi:RHS repeat-associated protein